MSDIIAELYENFAAESAEGFRKHVRTYLWSGLDRGQTRGVMLEQVRKQAGTMGDYGPEFLEIASRSLDRAIEIEYAN